MITETTKKKRRGGWPNPIDNPVLRERNLAIWRKHFYQKISIPDLEKEYKLTERQIYNCLSFVEKTLGHLPEKIQLTGSLFAIRGRIKDLMQLREEEIARPKKSIRNIIELEREIRADEDVELRLAGLLKSIVEIEIKEKPTSTKAILESIARADKEGVPENKKDDFIMADLRAREERKD